jgi:hypothetical protein
MEDAAHLLLDWDVVPGNEDAPLFLCDGNDVGATQWCWKEGHRQDLLRSKSESPAEEEMW